MNASANSPSFPPLEAGDELLDYLELLLTKPYVPEDLVPPEHYADNPNFQRLCRQITDLRELSSAISKGDMKTSVSSRGYVLSNMKTLQANLRHLLWLLERVSTGDYTQHSDYFGEISQMFNYMNQQLRDTRIHLHRLASLDELTQIPNRRALDVFLSDNFLTSQQSHSNFCVMMIDIDLFKRVNDQYGHLEGDKVLVQLSHIISQQFRSTDIFARYGGEEFVAGLPGSNLDTGFQAACRALQAVRDANFCIDGNTSLKMTVSIGVTSIRENDMSHSDMIQRCDKALYNAKRNGRNQVCVIE